MPTSRSSSSSSRSSSCSSSSSSISRADASSAARSPSEPLHISCTRQQPLCADSDRRSRSTSSTPDHLRLAHNSRPTGHPLPLTATPLSPQRTTSRLSRASSSRTRFSFSSFNVSLSRSALLALAIALILSAQPSQCAPLGAAAVGVGEAVDYELSGEQLQVAPESQAAGIAGTQEVSGSWPSSAPSGSELLGPETGYANWEPETHEKFRQYENGQYHQRGVKHHRGKRTARSVEHRCNTTMAEYGTSHYLEVGQNVARLVEFDPAGTNRQSARPAKRPRPQRVNVEIYSMHHMLHLSSTLSLSDDPLRFIPEVAARFREIARRHRESGHHSAHEEALVGHINHGVVAIFGLRYKRFLCLRRNGDAYTVQARPADGQPTFNADCLFVRVMGRRACTNDTSCTSSKSHDCEDMTVFLSYQHPTPYQPQDDGAYVNCTTFARDRSALRRDSIVSLETASHLLLGEGVRGAERLSLHSQLQRMKDDLRSDFESQASDLKGARLRALAEKVGWEKISWEVDECATTEVSVAPSAATPQPASDGVHAIQGADGNRGGVRFSADEANRRLPTPPQLPAVPAPTTRTTTSTPTTTTTTTPTPTTPTTTTPTTTRSPEDERNYQRQKARGAEPEPNPDPVIKALDLCKGQRGKFYEVNCVQKVLHRPPLVRPRPWEQPRNRNRHLRNPAPTRKPRRT